MSSRAKTTSTNGRPSAPQSTPASRDERQTRSLGGFERARLGVGVRGSRLAVREIDIDPTLAALLREHIESAPRRRVFETRNGSPLPAGNIRKRVLQPLLARLGLAKAGLHAFRHSWVTMLRKGGTPADLQKLWIGHSSLKTTDRYAHTDQELEYRRRAAAKNWVGSHCWTQSIELDPSPREGRERVRTCV